MTIEMLYLTNQSNGRVVRGLLQRMSPRKGGTRLSQMLYEYCPDVNVIVNDENGKLTKIKAKKILSIMKKNN